MERLIMLPGWPRPDGVPEIIRCGLNPSDIELRRDAGIVTRPAGLFGGDRRGGSAPASAAPRTNLAFGGSGRSTLLLRLVFETASVNDAPPADVRKLTEPLYHLSAPVTGQGDRPCPVDLIWGKAWSFRGAVSRLAETLDRFTSTGIATRSWLKVEFEALPPAWSETVPTSGLLQQGSS